MVITMSAARTFPSVSGLGNSAEMSMPTSAMAWTTAGFSSLAGWEPAEVTRTRPAASRFSSAAAIWDRPALWVHTNSTSGTPSITRSSRGSAGQPGRLGIGYPVLAGRVHGDRQQHAEAAAEDLGGDERRCRARRDPGIGRGQGPADRDGRIGEAGRGRDTGRRAGP